MLVSIFGFQNSSFTVCSRFLFQSGRLMQSQSYICSPFGFAGLFIPPLLISSPLPLTSRMLTKNEVRDDCVHWLCLSAWVIHGNGKVQTGAVGGHGFLLFSLLDAFFLKSLTNSKLEKNAREWVFFPPSYRNRRPFVHWHIQAAQFS